MIDELTIYNLSVKYPNTVDLVREVEKITRTETIGEISREMRVLYDNEYEKKIRADTIEEIFNNAKEIQLQQIENLTQSSRRNGKMWARYMVTYLGHIQNACQRFLKEKQ